MRKIFYSLFLMLFLSPTLIFAQFGKNKVQYKDFTWYYIQTQHFDIYFTQQGSGLAEFTSKAAEKALESIENSFRYKINNRVTIIVYNSTNDFQETNVTDQYLSEGIEGFTELFKNRVVIQFMGSYKELRHLIHHELTHAVINDMFFGGSYQNVISNNIQINIPLWFNEGMAEYQSLGWDVNTDMFIRDAAISEYLPDIQNLNGYFAYRGGQSVFYYIAKKYGKQKIGEIINRVKSTGSVEEGMKASIGLSIKELNERWKKDIKKIFWPDIARMKDPDEFMKRLTDHQKEGGFYNISPAISPQGDKIAFITNRDYYFDVYLMSAIDGKIIKKVVEGNRTADFEELNIITPGLSWSPDGTRIALAAKSNGYDVIYLIDVNTEEKEELPVNLEGVKSVAWSPDGENIAFVGHTAKQSDIYIYNLKTKKLTNLTNDIFTDNYPSWSADSKIIYFSSDRRGYLKPQMEPADFKIYNYNYNETDIYSVNIDNENIIRLTDSPNSNESFPVASPDGKEMIFISDANGINNIYKKRLFLNSNDSVSDVAELNAEPITNSLDGLYQLSTSKDGKKLTLSTMYQAGFDIFMINNPFDLKLDNDTIPKTVYAESLMKKEEKEPDIFRDSVETAEADSGRTGSGNIEIFTGNYIDTAKTKSDTLGAALGKYVFGNDITFKSDSAYAGSDQFSLKNNLDSNGDYKVHKYKITFSPDIIYANAGYSTLYGLLGTTVISFSDVLGNHRLVGVTSMQIDLKNSDYGLAYYYLPERLNLGVEGFHTARFVFLSRGLGTNLFRFRNYGASLSASYPINRFYRFDAGLNWLNVSSENLDDPSEPMDKVHYILPSLSFVHDNVLWGYTSPIDGTRYRFDVLGAPGILGSRNLSFYSLLGDYRTYFRFWNDYSFAFRLSGGYSGGKNPQRFFIGGIENWINRQFATTEIPLESASDFAFLTAALPLRGYDYAAEIGTKYALLNMEFRFPLIRYLVPGPLPILFSNILGTAFIDAGSAWNYNSKLRLFARDENNNIISKDLLTGTGVGARVFFLYFLLRFDVAWSYNVKSFSKPKFYFSLGADF